MSPMGNGSHQSATMSRDGSSGTGRGSSLAESGSNSRTPLAWQQRGRESAPTPKSGSSSSKFRHSISLSPSTDSSGRESSSEAETGRGHYRLNHRGAGKVKGNPHYSHSPLLFPYHKSGTLRSSQSMPGLSASLGSTFDGHPCPVHGGTPHFQGPHPSLMRRGRPYPVLMPYPPPPGLAHHLNPRRSGSMFDLRASPAPSFYGTHRPQPILLHGPPGGPQRIYEPLPLSIGPPPSHYGSLRSLASSVKTANSGGVILQVPNHYSLSRPASVIGLAPPPPPPSHLQQGGFPLPPPSHHPTINLPPMPPDYLLPPGARPLPMVIPAEPLPVRDPGKAQKAMMALPAKDDNGKKQYSCCKGPMPFVWFVVIIVSVGVILGLILGFTLG